MASIARRQQPGHRTDPAVARALRSGQVHPALLTGGAGLLLYRTVALLAGGGRIVLKPWVVALTVVEMVLDVVTTIGSLRWWATRSAERAPLALRAGAATTLVHAARVSIFVLGRTGPWQDFDVRRAHRAGHRQRWTWGQVVFAGVLSALGVVAVLRIWQARRTPPRTAARAPGGRRHQAPGEAGGLSQWWSG